MTSNPNPANSAFQGVPAEAAALKHHLRDLSLLYLQRCVETPHNDPQHSSLLHLYSAISRLHRAVEHGDAAKAILEICGNLMACEQMAILVAHPQGNKAVYLESVGLTPKQLEAMWMDAHGIIHDVDELYVQGCLGKPHPFLSSLGISAVAPFWMDSATRGAIVLFDFLPQRNGLHQGDRELLKLLSAYAGPCLSSDVNKERESLQ